MRLTTKDRRRHEDVLPLLVCETCDCEVELLDEHADRGVCRQCGIAFLLDVAEARRVG